MNKAKKENSTHKILPYRKAGIGDGKKEKDKGTFSFDNKERERERQRKRGQKESNDKFYCGFDFRL